MTPRASLGHVVLHWRPQLGGRGQHILEVTRHDADDHGVIVAGEATRLVESDLSPDDRAVAGETPAPQRVAEDHDVRSVGAIVRGAPISSNDRSNAEHAEVMHAHPLTV